MYLTEYILVSGAMLVAGGSCGRRDFHVQYCTLGTCLSQTDLCIHALMEPAISDWPIIFHEAGREQRAMQRGRRRR